MALGATPVNESWEDGPKATTVRYLVIQEHFLVQDEISPVIYRGDFLFVPRSYQNIETPNHFFWWYKRGINVV